MKSNWKKVRDDKDWITVVYKPNTSIYISAHKNNPAPKGKYQGWDVIGVDKLGTFFRKDSLNSKKEAIGAIADAKRIYEQRCV